MSIDGRIAMQNGESQWITSKNSREDVQKFRAKSSAILTSSTTILNDNPLLTVRHKDFNKETLSVFPKKIFQHPIRVIIDSKNRVKKSHKIIQTKEKILLMRLKLDKEIWPENIKQIIMNSHKENVDLLSVLKFLGNSEINNLWIEAGSTLSGSFLKLELIDEIIIYMAPKILGHKAKPLFIFDNKLKLFNCLKFNFKDIRRIGPDIRLKLEPKNKKF
ncbi:bifunctional diaminohydroxyphosphoribosylaminopyrimidine deaminase/5-amino-6-(5-phosphoribosylamino)uracil reductase RibD [Buchnera aphidicola (Rhopalosiphum padi)]|jgi:5-amino-6-(5-phosphoribosylamino)uracil reductase|uniref:5-amino-6-(5-phosphoribosylamino)uracil reductase n=1 Tax=Buchnera aphidicola subsp. Rhopalosiphum padi TaxID=98793 RepID=A0A4D6YK36_BUCRP|nr:bifunctional diaminohydroxyphosphoribosylaminopyrimidine deaminase/5-amino-6-(5-phosphoribosylamino)uracil reductase RibD [Buchnera aphidicola (Rhopalosiphum padi)]